MDPDLLLNKREDTGRDPDTGVPQCYGSETLLETTFSPIVVVIPCSFSDVLFTFQLGRTVSVVTVLLITFSFIREQQFVFYSIHSSLFYLSEVGIRKFFFSLQVSSPQSYGIFLRQQTERRKLLQIFRSGSS